MTSADLRQLLEAATPGPWTARAACSAPERSFVETEHRVVAEWVRTKDAALIAAVRNLGPELLALWEACNNPVLGRGDNPTQSMSLWISDINNALQALNRKAETL